MKITYDPDADAMYIRFKDGPSDHTKEMDENTIIDFDKDGKVIGVELLFVRARNPNLLKLQTENIQALAS